MKKEELKDLELYHAQLETIRGKIADISTEAENRYEDLSEEDQETHEGEILQETITDLNCIYEDIDTAMGNIDCVLDNYTKD